MRQRIRFETGDRRLGIDITAVREIRAWSPATPLPHVAAIVGGVVNDAVIDIAMLNDNETRLVPDAGDSTTACFLQGVATVGERLRMILGSGGLAEAAAPLAEAA